MGFVHNQPCQLARLQQRIQSIHRFQHARSGYNLETCKAWHQHASARLSMLLRRAGTGHWIASSERTASACQRMLECCGRGSFCSSPARSVWGLHQHRRMQPDACEAGVQLHHCFHRTEPAPSHLVQLLQPGHEAFGAHHPLWCHCRSTPTVGARLINTGLRGCPAGSCLLHPYARWHTKHICWDRVLGLLLRHHGEWSMAVRLKTQGETALRRALRCHSAVLRAAVNILPCHSSHCSP